MSKRYARQLHSADGLIAAVEQHGFLPSFGTRFTASPSRNFAHLSYGLRMM